MKKIRLPLTLFFSIFLLKLQAQPIVSFIPQQSGFSSPVDIANAGDGSDRIFIVERGGIIKIIQGATTLPTPFLNISSQISCCGERGLLGLVFHPAYSSNGYFFVNYTDSNGDTRISRFSVDPADSNLALPGSELLILKVDQPFSNHNAGDLNFGPLDGYLYIGLGDGGSGGDPGDRSQNPNCLLGKMLRIDVNGLTGGEGSSPQTGPCGFDQEKNYTIPPTNPFVGTAGVLDEIWSIGWRNPWRFTFDSQTGEMWVADVGQNAWEEVDLEASGTGGLNYGWRCYEGNHAYNTANCSPQSSYVDAVFEYGHNSSGGYSITGGIVYRGSDYPGMQGHYIATDYITGNTWTLSKNASGTVVAEVQNVPGISSITTYGVRENGEMLAASIGGQIYTVEDMNALPIALVEFTGRADREANLLSWSTSAEINADRFDIEKGLDGISFEKIGEIAARNQQETTLAKYSFSDRSSHGEKNYYRLRLLDADGSYSYSSTIVLEHSLPFGIQLHPNPSEGLLKMSIAGKKIGVTDVQIFDVGGNLIYEGQLDTDSRNLTVDLSGFPANIYFVRASSEAFTRIEKLIIK